ncbi:angiomotin-like isoform X2 [Haliotis rufescens]|uniref:angiomotin-like isoform X2 n=1 Tax=Haliotis rufescens TaxID=6454 RepID=UPI00201EE527|nr:angiomotin-like isoform X2 [Haliotis rufescens]
MLTMRLSDYPLGGLTSHYAPTYDEVIAMQNQYREPPPYPGHSKQLYNQQPGLRQSFSGSETSTDVSVSSTENLATSQRQEPQGEETQTQNLYNQLDLNPTDSDYSILARLGMPTPSSVELKPTPVPAYFITGPPQGKVYTVHSEASPVYAQGQLTVPQWSPQMVTTTQSPVTVSRSVEYNQNLISTYRTIPQYVNSQWSPQSSTDQGSQLISYLSNLPPPPEYPGPRAPNTAEKTELRKSSETMDKIELTRSQPDLSRLSDSQSKVAMPVYASDPKFSTAGLSHAQNEEVDHLNIAARTTQVIEMLSEENRRLRDELEINYKKVSKLQKFEFEIEKVHEAYESLVKSSEKRERLEATLKKRLEDELKKARAENTEIREKMETSLKESQNQRSEDEKEAHLGKLLAQRQGQEKKLDILDSTLTNTRLVHLGQECSTKQGHLDKMEQMQKSLMSLQSASERREQMDRQLRAKLEKELDSLRAQQKLGWKRIPGQNSDTMTVMMLQQMLSEKEAKILEMESDIAKWEQRYLEESTLRQLMAEDSAGTKDIRLAALEKNSAETEKLIDEAKSEKLKHMEELYQANRTVAELEARVKSLQTQLTEKEATLKLVQRSPMTRSSSVHTIYCSPLHSPRPSVISTSSLSRQSSQSDAYRDFATIKHVKTGSASAIDSRSAVEEELREKFKDLQSESKDDSDEEGKLLMWQV